MATTTPSENRLKKMSRSSKIPPVYLPDCSFPVYRLMDFIYSDGQMYTNPNIMLNIVVR